ncbi:hypothetical protein P280DRAFT_87714 [Massarina eburnea CBS 473.64]|uniref:Uncharacterized protein n=1 Tax=Massarina eburnea CBS 473.64 TaxID=1395130 RepID=A0A6A6RTI8_9PLEO|nr:hypothetical protein P280DRAFT_87714 [Massarina eburnea CBS 473.64]
MIVPAKSSREIAGFAMTAETSQARSFMQKAGRGAPFSPSHAALPFRIALSGMAGNPRGVVRVVRVVTMAESFLLRWPWLHSESTAMLLQDAASGLPSPIQRRWRDVFLDNERVAVRTRGRERQRQHDPRRQFVRRYRRKIFTAEIAGRPSRASQGEAQQGLWAGTQGLNSAPRRAPSKTIEWMDMSVALREG